MLLVQNCAEVLKLLYILLSSGNLFLVGIIIEPFGSFDQSFPGSLERGTYLDRSKLKVLAAELWHFRGSVQIFCGLCARANL